MASTTSASQTGQWFAYTAQECLTALESSPDGLNTTTAQQRRAVNGPNELPAPPRPSAWQVVLRQWRDPMTVLLTVLIFVCILAGQVETAVLVTLLVLLNVGMGAQQQLKARASADDLESLNVANARVIRDGRQQLVSAAEVVVGDIIFVEAGDMIPADARIISCANLEVVESALTGESAPVNKDADALTLDNPPLGDRTCILFQNTSITRGSAQAVVVATGTKTEMGRIATMLNDVKQTSSPLQLELNKLTVRLAIVCLLAVAFIVVIGLVRGLDSNQIVLVAIATAISSIPSGLPTFLTAMLAYGAQRLAKVKAVVRNLTDVETLGSVSAINSDKTGTLTMDMMTAESMFESGRWFSVDGSGYAPTGEIRRAAGQPVPDFTMLGYGLTLCSDATIAADGSVVGDPTELALVVLAAKMGVDAAISRREYPRAALVPFDSAYKFMATFHVAPMEDDGPNFLIGLVKGAPDVVIDRCTHASWHDEIVPIEEVREQLDDANAQLAKQGLRVMSFAYRQLDVAATEEVANDPMAAVEQLVFVSLVGIIDPLRPAAKDAVQRSLRAGIDVRMITGDHAVTAKAIADDLGLGPGVITGQDFDSLTDTEVIENLDNLHVFGRVTPQDKLRLVTVMQESGKIVAMTGDAVNDAAALKKADVGVAMGSGSEVTKQAANIVLTDDNFATLIHAVELGRDIYSKITSQIRYVMVGLFAVLALMLLASVLGINDGNALTATQLIFVTFLVGLFPAIAISTDSVEPGIMDQPPRDPSVSLLNSATLPRWLIFGIVQAIAGLAAFVIATETGGNVIVAQTMTFAVMGITMVLAAGSLRRDKIPVWEGPFMPYFLWLAIPLAATVLAVEWDVLQPIIGTAELDGAQWAIVFGLSVICAIIVELDKWLRSLMDRK